MRVLPILLSLLIGASAVTGQGSSVNLSPTLVLLTYGTTTSSIAVRNDSARAMGFRLQAFQWTNGPAGVIELTPTDDVIVFPTGLALQPGETRRVRLGTQVEASAVERSYRLIVEEVASPTAVQRYGLTTRLKFSVPVFVQPKDRTLKISLLTPDLTRGSLRLELLNQGRLHVTPQAVEAKGLDAAGARVWSRTFKPWYVLQGETRAYSSSLSSAECRSTAVIVADATFAEGSRLALHEERRVNDTNCAER